ncbi:J domain-containing protein [Pontixanthobacter aestiaquae]|uniref:DnaJ domain-containing protein n=1 Tax=Pontixanthobacter aestiaquae TaxID=1509367 RepID=A0A844Z751_9SPHN|nr:J domain-containing protein [Pontixanthobacter aestiaquae]MDN3646306.1 J domain-containing protein [Pontixanthobacter aestiaquae]MXO82703.1 DnaJ domain-containing protein [Pontixanthobacter aestiaquae]
MAGKRRKDSWGFPNWGGYEKSQDAVAQKECDRHGCEEAGLCPAPKTPNSPERWYFCQKHAAEYNRGWDYFEGLDKEEAAERKRTEQRDADAYTEASHYGWAGGTGDGGRTADEMLALEALELEADADFAAIKKSFRIKAKAVHPDVKPGDEEAAKQFQKIQVAYEVLKQAEDRRAWMGSA